MTKGWQKFCVCYAIFPEIQKMRTNQHASGNEVLITSMEMTLQILFSRLVPFCRRLHALHMRPTIEVGPTGEHSLEFTYLNTLNVTCNWTIPINSGWFVRHRLTQRAYIVRTCTTEQKEIGTWKEFTVQPFIRVEIKTHRERLSPTAKWRTNDSFWRNIM